MPVRCRAVRAALLPLYLLVLLVGAVALEAPADYGYDGHPHEAGYLAEIDRLWSLDQGIPARTELEGPTTHGYDDRWQLARRSSRRSGHGVAPSAARGLQFADEAVEGFGSMSSFRRAYGSAGPNVQWHHVVEQHSANVGRFGAQSIHNTSNIVRLDSAIHQQVSGYYSSIQPFTGGQTVRQWVSTNPSTHNASLGLRFLSDSERRDDRVRRSYRVGRRDRRRLPERRIAPR